MLTLILIITESLALSLLNGMLGVNSFVITSIAIILASSALLLDIFTNKELANYRIGLVAAYVMRLFILYFDLYGRAYYTLPNSGGDSEMFYREALKSSQGFAHRDGTFIELIAGFINLVGDNRLFIQYLLMLCSVAALVMLAYTVNKIKFHEEDGGKSIFMIACLLPNLSIVSSLLLRESLVFLASSAALLQFVKWMVNGDDIDLAGAVVAVLTGSMFHSGIVVMVVVFSIARLLYLRLWTEASLARRKPRLDTSETIIAAGYDVRETAAWLQNIYLDLSIRNMKSKEEKC